MCEIEDKPSYLTVTQRYYEPRYVLEVQGKPLEDHCVLFHNNRICVVTVAPTHPIVADRKSISKIDFQITENTNRLENKVSGKGKRGGQWLTKTSPLCKVVCSDGSEFTLFSCVNGKLVEVNDSLLTNPALIVTKPQSDGFIAIVLPKFGQSEPQKEALLSFDQYTEAVNQRRL